MANTQAPAPRQSKNAEKRLGATHATDAELMISRKPDCQHLEGKIRQIEALIEGNQGQVDDLNMGNNNDTDTIQPLSYN